MYSSCTFFMRPSRDGPYYVIEYDLIWTRTHYLQDSRWAWNPLHHLTWPDLDSNPLSTRLMVSMLSITSPDLTWTRTHYLQDFKVSMLSITSPDLDSNPLSTRLQGEHGIHYITWRDLTWTQTHYLQDFKLRMLSITSPDLTWPGL